jgi:transaldolase
MSIVTDARESVVERLAKTAPGLEIWWDSSPLVYKSWTGRMLANAAPEKKPVLTEQLRRLYDLENPTATLFRGVTTNPPLSLAVINDNPDYWGAWIDEYNAAHPAESVEQVFWSLYKEIVRHGAEAFRPVFESSGYRYGHISGQVDPRFAFDADTMLPQALELSALAPNVMIKIPGSAQGIPVLRELTARGIPTNCTLAYTVPQFVAVAEAVQAGLLEARINGVDLTRWKSVVTYMSARWENMPEFVEQGAQAGLKLTLEDRRWAGVAIFKHAYRIFRARAYPSKMLICSLRLGPVVDGIQHVWHLEETAGADAIFTCPPVFLTDLFKQADHIEFEPRIWNDIPEDVKARLRRVPYFTRAYEVDGLTPAEFNTLPPLVSTYREFSAATENMIAFVRERMHLPESADPSLHSGQRLRRCTSVW